MVKLLQSIEPQEEEEAAFAGIGSAPSAFPAMASDELFQALNHRESLPGSVGVAFHRSMASIDWVAWINRATTDAVKFRAMASTRARQTPADV